MSSSDDVYAVFEADSSADRMQFCCCNIIAGWDQCPF